MGGKVVTIRLRLLVALLVVIVIGGIAAYWAQERIAAHASWASELTEVQQFQTHMNVASGLVAGAASDKTQRSWMYAELLYSENAISNIQGIDQAHFVKLGTLWRALENLRVGLTPYLASLNSTQLYTLSSDLYMIEIKFVAAYENFLYYGTHPLTGPDFWYNGPAPPDETLLQQTIDLAVTMPGLPPLG